MPAIAAVADVAITNAGPATASVGDNVTFTVTVHNAGPDVANDIVVTDPMSPSLVLEAATPDRGTCDVSGGLDCHIGSLANAETATIVVVVAAIRAGAFTMTAHAESTDDASPGNNTAARTLAVAGPTCTVVGTPGIDALAGSGSPDVLCGLGGNDVIDVGSADRALGGDGNDVLTARGSDATLEGGRGNDQVDGGIGNDLLSGGLGDDVMNGAQGDDYLDGGPGTDTNDGGIGVNACADGGASCYLTSPTDPRDTAGPLDIKAVQTVFDKTSTFTIMTWSRWSMSAIFENGFFLLRFDTVGTRAVDYIAVVRNYRGTIRATLFRVSTRWDVPVVNLTAWQRSSSSIVVRVPFQYMQRGEGRVMYRWGASTLWSTTACWQGVCVDRLPASTGLLPQPLP